MPRNIPYNENHKITEDGELLKKCNHHYIYFPDESPWFPCTEEYFYKTDKNKTDGLHPECKRCGIVKSHVNQVENEERSKKNKISWYNDHKELNWERANQWKIDNPEYARKCYREWQKSESGQQSSKKSRNKRKEKEHIFYEIEWINLKKYFDNKCCYCGLPIEEHYILYRGKTILGDFHKDHAIDQGRNDIKNTLPACESCNSSKHTKTLNEFYNPSNPNYTRERYLKIYQWLRHDYKKYILPKRRFKGQRMIERLKEVEFNKNKNKRTKQTAK